MRVSWTLEELGLDWDYFYINLAKGVHRSDAYLQINPNGRSPALRDGDVTLIESGAICRFLAEKYGPQLLAEPGSAESALMNQWLSFTTTELEQALWSMGKHKFALPKEQRLTEMLDVASWEFERAARVAEIMLPDTPYICGEQFTIADIILTHTLNWAVAFNQQLPDNLSEYRKRLSQRPAMSKGLEKEMRFAAGG